MERRNRALEAYDKLVFASSLDDEQRANILELWAKEFLENEENLKFSSKKELELFMEQFYLNLQFMKKYRKDISKFISTQNNVKKFL